MSRGQGKGGRRRARRPGGGWGACLAFVIALHAPVSAQADRPSWLGPTTREGITFSLGAGVGYQVFSANEGFEAEFGFVAPSLELSLGVYISDVTALFLGGTLNRVVVDALVFTPDTFTPLDAEVTRLAGIGVLGVAYWPIDGLMTRLGIGSSYVSASVAFDDVALDDVRDSDTGLALLAGLAVPFWNNREQGLHIGFEWEAGLFSGGTVHDVVLRLSWHAY